MFIKNKLCNRFLFFKKTHTKLKYQRLVLCSDANEKYVIKKLAHRAERVIFRFNRNRIEFVVCLWIFYV